MNIFVSLLLLSMLVSSAIQLNPDLFCRRYLAICLYMGDQRQQKAVSGATQNNAKCFIPEYCHVKITQKTVSNYCMKQRRKDRTLAQDWYKLTVAGKKQTIRFPFPVPWLNQSMEAVKLRVATDPLESRWLSSIGVLKGVIQKLNGSVFDSMGKSPFHSYDEYRMVYEIFNDGIKRILPAHLYGNPMFASGTVKNVINNDFWLTDEFFVQKRLAGPCPFQLQKVTTQGNVGINSQVLFAQINLQFDWSEALSIAYGAAMTFRQAIRNGILYVLYHPEHNGLPTMDDQLDIDPNDSRTLMNMTSPIGFFIKQDDGNLKVVAIQMDYTPDSIVYSPNSDPMKWILARSMLDSVDSNVCQAVQHLSHIHFTSTVYCTVFRRHFSKLHPLYDVMLHQCVGTTPHISLSYPVLSTPNQPGHLLVGVGHLGFVHLALAGYAQYYYGILDFDNLLKSRGLYDRTIAYYPFRDDGAVIWNELKNFANKFVNQYYSDDVAVSNDQELQDFANEISFDGKLPPDGGNGKIKKFPTSFQSKSALERFVTSFLWLNVFHTVVNYPVEPYNSFLPIGPTKLYKDTDPAAATNFCYVLPDAPTTIGVASFASTLGNFRLNRIMDHYEQVKDLQLRKLVRGCYIRFHTCIQELLEKRNAKRVAKNLLPFQYLEPKWLTNSIHV